MSFIAEKSDYFLRMLMGIVTVLGVKYFRFSTGSVTEPRIDSDVSSLLHSVRPHIRPKALDRGESAKFG